VVINNRKLAGTLAEARSAGGELEYVVLGLGLNTNFPSSALTQITDDATTILDVLGHEIENTEILAGILHELEQLYERVSLGNEGAALHLLMQTDSSAGRRLTIHLENESFTGLFESYLTLSRVRILDDSKNQRDVETSGVVAVDYLPA